MTDPTAPSTKKDAARIHVPERSTPDADPRVAPREAPSEDDAVARRMEGPAASGPAGQQLEEVLVLDFGGQYSQLIARRIRECGVFAELLPHDTPIEEIRGARAPRPGALRWPGLGLRGRRARPPHGAARARHPGARHLLRDAGDGPDARRPGREAPSRASSAAPSSRCATAAARCSRACRPSSSCWMSHRDTVFEPPPGFTALASSPELAGRRLRGARPRPLRDPVPPRGRPHALRHRDPHPLPARRRRLRASSGRRSR